MFLKGVTPKNYLRIGAISRSSKFLYKKMTCSIDFSNDLNIVEFGPGDGVFTDNLIKETTPSSKISVFEIDKDFCKLLKEKYKDEPKVVVYEENACDVTKYFEKESVDYVISSLPLALINKNQVLDILKKSEFILKKGGKFIQYQYFLQNRSQIKKCFSKVSYKFTLLNLPPAFVYICYK